VAGKVPSLPVISLLPEGNRRDVVFEPHEYQALLDNLPQYLRPVIESAYTTGWRINSELLTLQKRDADLDSGCLRLEAGETSDKRARSFPLTRELSEVLTRQLRATAEFERKSGQIVPWLFHREGKPIKDFRKAWALACRRTGVPDKVPDDLRRTAVRNLERAGVSRSAAMAMVGHRSESIYRGIALADEIVLNESAVKLAAFHQSEKAAKHLARP
jgi:integrase